MGKRNDIADMPSEGRYDRFLKACACRTGIIRETKGTESRHHCEH
jgi:hypothetical protein